MRRSPPTAGSKLTHHTSPRFIRTVSYGRFSPFERLALDEALKQVARPRAVNRCYIAFCGLADISNGRGEIEPGQSNVGAIHDPRIAGSPASAARGAASVALLLGRLVAPGCRESALGPDVPESNVVLADGRERGDDPYIVNSLAVAGHRLTIKVSYAGGYRNHAFTLVISTSFGESDPVQLPVVLAHDANGDACEAWLTESHRFDLALVRARYRQFYGPGPGTVVLRIKGVLGDDLVYEFAG